MKIKRYLSGLTLVELLAVLAILVIVVSIIVPNFFSTLRKSRDDNAIQRATVLDISKISFNTDKGKAARVDWTNAVDDNARYQLLKDYLVNPSANLGDGLLKGDYYTPEGYLYTFNDLTNQTTVIRRSDNAVLVEPSSDP